MARLTRSIRRVTALEDDLALALELADVADAITLARYQASDLAVSTKPDLTPVTEADTAAERAIRARLAESRPSDAVVGEEYGDQNSGAARRWIIDPIDGTKNYVRGVPVWATLLALEEAGSERVAVVSAPSLGRRWWGSRGGGAFARDGITGATRRLSVSRVASLEDAQLSVGGLAEWLSDGRRERFLELVGRAWRTRGFGDFWAYMLLAEGAEEVVIDAPGVSLWDLAAPTIIVEESGCRFTDLAGVATAAGGEAVATNGLLHDAALAIVGR
jgi:histidinol-phosphatase